MSPGATVAGGRPLKFIPLNFSEYKLLNTPHRAPVAGGRPLKSILLGFSEYKPLNTPHRAPVVRCS